MKPAVDRPTISNTNKAVAEPSRVTLSDRFLNSWLQFHLCKDVTAHVAASAALLEAAWHIWKFGSKARQQAVSIFQQLISRLWFDPKITKRKVELIENHPKGPAKIRVRVMEFEACKQETEAFAEGSPFSLLVSAPSFTCPFLVFQNHTEQRHTLAAKEIPYEIAGPVQCGFGYSSTSYLVITLQLFYNQFTLPSVWNVLKLNGTYDLLYTLRPSIFKKDKKGHCSDCTRTEYTVSHEFRCQESSSFGKPWMQVSSLRICQQLLSGWNGWKASVGSLAVDWTGPIEGSKFQFRSGTSPWSGHVRSRSYWSAIALNILAAALAPSFFTGKWWGRHGQTWYAWNSFKSVSLSNEIGPQPDWPDGVY